VHTTEVAGLPCRGQLLEVPPGTYAWLRLLVSGWAEDAGPLEVWLHHRDSVEPE